MMTLEIPVLAFQETDIYDIGALVLDLSINRQAGMIGFAYRLVVSI